MENTFTVVHHSRFLQAIGAYTFQATSETEKVRVRFDVLEKWSHTCLPPEHVDCKNCGSSTQLAGSATIAFMIYDIDRDSFLSFILHCYLVLEEYMYYYTASMDLYWSVSEYELTLKVESLLFIFISPNYLTNCMHPTEHGNQKRPNKFSKKAVKDSILMCVTNHLHYWWLSDDRSWSVVALLKTGDRTAVESSLWSRKLIPYLCNPWTPPSICALAERRSNFKSEAYIICLSKSNKYCKPG